MTLATLRIRIYPDPVLRMKCADVEEFGDELKRLAEDMVETMHAAPGIGLAASQVARRERLAVVDLSVGEDPDGLLVLVNPVIKDPQGQEVDSEGCLSLPDFSEKICRAERIRVLARDLEGESFELEAEGLLARAVQHEVDHLDGVLVVDHLRGLRRERARRYLKRLRADQNEGRD